MFDAGSFELIFLILIGVIVLGPEKLPAVARTLGNWVRRGRSMAGEFQRELEKEVDLQEVKKLHQEVTEVTEPLKDSVKKNLDEGNSILDRGSDSIKKSLSLDDASQSASASNSTATNTTPSAAPDGHSTSDSSQPDSSLDVDAGPS